MLDSLDTLIAFAVVMSILSLLVTIITQMISSALALRGKNLANALALTFQTVDPQIKEHAHALTHRLLTDPLLSDSLLTTKSRDAFADSPEVTAARAKLAITQAAFDAANAVVPLVAAVVNATKTARDTDQAALDTALLKTLRQKPLNFRSRGGWRYATAIRPDEIYRTLKRISELRPGTPGASELDLALRPHVARLLAGFGGTNPLAADAQARINATLGVIATFTTPEQQEQVLGTLSGLAGDIVQVTGQAYDRFERWFNSSQDRAKQWFATHTRYCTIGGACLVAFALQFDSIDLYHTLSTNPEVRANVAKAASAVLEQGDAVFDARDTPARHAYLVWLEQHPGFTLDPEPPKPDMESYAAAVQKRVIEKPDFTPELAAFHRIFKPFLIPPKDGKPDPKDLKKAYDTWRSESGFRKAALPEAPAEPKLEDLLTAYKAALDKSAAATKAAAATAQATVLALETPGHQHHMSDRAARADRLRKIADEAGVQIVWKEYPKGYGERWNPQRVLGVLLSAALLSLGAPTWYKLLGQLTNLRPLLATLVDQRPTQDDGKSK